MTPERLEIARRFARCKRWKWRRGMTAVRGDGREGRIVVVSIDHSDPARLVQEAFVSMPMRVALPDLDDEVTRHALCPVVRKAWGRDAWVREDEDGFFVCEAIFRSPGLVSMERLGAGPTELNALLAALECAP